MKKTGKKMHTRLRVQQRLNLKTIIIASTCFACIILLFTILFNVFNIRQVKASPLDIRQADEQVFITNMSIQNPQINYKKAAGPNTIFIHKIKPVQK